MESEYPIDAMESDVSPLSTDDERTESEDIYMTPQAGYEGRKTQSLYSIAGTPNKRTPIFAASREIKELQSKLLQCRAEVLFAMHREREARNMLPKEVDSIMDEFYKLQLESVNLNEEMQKVMSALQQITAERDECRLLLAAVQLKQQNDDKELHTLVDGGNKLDNTPGGVPDYVDFSINSTVMDPDIIEIQQKLTDALEENTKLFELNSQLQEEMERLGGPSQGSFSNRKERPNEAVVDWPINKQAPFGLLSPAMFYVAGTSSAEPCIFTQPGASLSDDAFASRISVPPFDVSTQGNSGLLGCATKPSRGNFGCIIL